MPKSHAKDYLLEYAQNSSEMEGWLKELIYRAISTNGSIPENVVDGQLYDLLKSGENTLVSPPSGIGVSHSISLVLKELTHISGVSAIAPNQTITFAPTFTLVYGLNGSGKSSYFRMLNAVCGGNIEYELKGNIYEEASAPIKFKLKYECDNTEKEDTFDENFHRGSVPFNAIRVFDTGYASKIIESPGAEATVINPFGLHLFRYISDIMDYLKEKLIEEKNMKFATLPFIDTALFSDGYKTYFTNKKFKEDVQLRIEALSFTHDNDKQIANLAKEIDELQKSDLSSKIRLIEQEMKSISSLSDKIKNVISDITNFDNETKDSVIMYCTKLNASEESKLRHKVLEELKQTDTPQWKEFIKAGQSYTNLIGDKSEKCPYCNQPLSQHARDLLSAYSNFLLDKTEQELRNATDKVAALKNRFENYEATISVDDIIKDEVSILPVDGNMTLGQYVANLNEQTRKHLLLLVHSLDSRKAEFCIFQDSSVHQVLHKLDVIADQKREKLNLLEKDSKERQKKISELQIKLSELKERKSLVEQKSTIASWNILVREAERLAKISNNINTRNITTLSKTAHEELLTNSLCATFSQELQKIGFDKLDVQLVMGSMKKGSASLQLKLLQEDDFKAILSEGEKKGVALALFLSEIKTQHNQCPIIFDDPVNSLDNKIIENFADMLKDLSNQVIVFSHNILFRERLRSIYGKEFCGISLQTFSKNEKGVVCNDDHKTYGSFLQEAQIGIRDKQSLSIISLDLRSAIEHIIDEKVLGDATPTRFSNGQSVKWDSLKNVSGNVNIDVLQSCYRQLSHRTPIHRGVAEEENPLDYRGLLEILSQLKDLVGMH